jgi:hypothetical protein
MERRWGIPALIYALPVIASGAAAELAFDRPALSGLIFRPRSGWQAWIPHGLHGVLFALTLAVALAHLFRALKWGLAAKGAALLAAAVVYLALDFFVTIIVAGWHGDFM